MMFFLSDNKTLSSDYMGLANLAKDEKQNIIKLNNNDIAKAITMIDQS